MASMTSETTSRIELIPADVGEALRAVRLCAPEAERQMQLSLSRLGQLTAVQVYEADGRLELIDGFKRLYAARALSWPSLRAELRGEATAWTHNEDGQFENAAAAGAGGAVDNAIEKRVYAAPLGVGGATGEEAWKEGGSGRAREEGGGNFVRKREYPGIEVRPLKFGAAELQTSHWRFLMGAVGSQATYIRQLNRVMKSLREDLTLEGLKQGVEASSLPDHLKSMARMRLELASEYIDDAIRLKDEIRPGRLIIVDLRDEFIEKDEALGLFVVLLQLFADAKYRDARGAEHSFNKLVVFDEAHKYIESPDLVAGLIEVVREMRHKGTSIMVASQDPPSVPIALIELSSQVILHKFNSPAWLKHIQKANAALGSLTPEKMANLRPGEAFIWSSKATDDAFMKGAVKIRCRPR
ncbi:MAG: hypothetical protein ACT4TC_10835 [Myxococcaceae bacterium]